MGAPPVKGPALLPKMGVRARLSDWSKKDICDVQPPPRSDSLVPSFLQASPDIRLQFLDLRSPSSRGGLMRMKRSNSEVTISDVGAEDLDPASINPNTGASLRKRYDSTSTLDRQNSSEFAEDFKVKLEPSAPPPLPDPACTLSPVSPSLQAAAQIARGEIVYIQGRDYVTAAVSRGQEHIQKKKTEMSIFSRLRGSRSNKNQVQQWDGGCQRSDRSQVRQQDGTASSTPHRFFSHYDVQSVLFNLGELSLCPSTRTLAEARCPDAHDQVFTALAGGRGLDGDERSCGLVLHCPLCRHHTGGKTERNLDLSQACSTTCRATCSQALLSCTNAAVSVLEACQETPLCYQKLLRNYDIEHNDLGARYYLEYFYNKDHQNYFGVDQNFGPVSLSIRREQLDQMRFNYRIILRTASLSTLRGSILEDSVPSVSKHGTTHGLPLKDILEFVLPELSVQSLRLASRSFRVPELLVQLDQQELLLQHRVAVWFCRGAETTNHDTSASCPALDQFLDLLGFRVPQKGFKYQNLLDITGDQRGSPSVCTTFRDFELIFQVSALPLSTAAGTTQLPWEHLENNFVTVIFQEPEAPPFSLQNMGSCLQHVFIIIKVHWPCSQHTCYSIGVSRCAGVPPFGPMIPPGKTFPASPMFRDFLLTKVVNARHAVDRSQMSVAKVTRHRQEQLQQLVETFSTSTLADSSSAKFSLFLWGERKKERQVPWPHAHLQSGGALTWRVVAQNSGGSTTVVCRLAVSREMLVLVEEASRQVVFNCNCRDVIGWTASHGDVRLFYGHGHCVMFSTWEGRGEELQEISQRLQMVTRGGVAESLTLRRNQLGQLGFHINVQGVVADVEVQGSAWQAGLRPGCRLVEICSVAVVTLSHEQLMELLCTSATVSAVVIPPHDDGMPRRSFSETFRVLPPTCKQVPSAPATPTMQSNQSAGPELRTHPETRTFDVKEGCSSPSMSTSSDPELSVRQQSHSHSRVLPDWSFSSDESTCGRSNRTRTEKNKHLMTNVLTQFQLSPVEADSNTKQRFSGKGVSKCSTTLSSSSSDDQHSNPALTFMEGMSMDSGIDSTLCSSSALPPVAAATLVLREGLREEMMTSACHVTDFDDSCSSSRVSCPPVRDDLIREMKSEGKSISRASVVHHVPPWMFLSRSKSDADLFRSVSLPSSCRKLHRHGSTPLPARQQRELCWHANTVTEQKPLHQVSSHMDWSHLVDSSSPVEAGVCSSMSLCDIHQLLHTQEVTSGSFALQDSDMTASLSGKVLQLEENLRQLQLDLLKEQRDKAALQQQVQNLRHHNLHLQEESHSSAQQIRRFTSWMNRRDLLP